MASHKLLVTIIIFMSSCTQLVFPFSYPFVSLKLYRELSIKADQWNLFPRNDTGILWSNLFVKKLRELAATTKIADSLQGLQDPVCKAHLVYIGSQLDQWINHGTLPDTFVLQLIDSWGKLPSGILRGHLTDPGDFEECIHAEGYLNSSRFPRNAKGAYSMSLLWITPEAAGRKIPGPYPNRTSSTAVSPNELMDYMFSDSGALMSMLPMFGTCFPNTCSLTDAQQFVSNVIRATFGDQVYMRLFPRITAEKPLLSVKAVGFVLKIAALLCACLIGTILDLQTLNYVGNENIGGVISVLKSFSLYTNTLNVLNSHEIEPRMRCLRGLEFLSFAWILLAQSWDSLNYQITWNAIDLRESIRSGWEMMFILNATVAFDSLFLINGFITGYRLLEKLEKEKKLNPLPLYGWRYIQMTLPVLFMAAFGATLLPHMGNGPFWYVIDAEAQSCASNWWHNILHLSTLFHYDVADPQNFICHANSWYVADDMIFFLVAPIFMYVLWRWTNSGLCLLSFWIIQPLVLTCMLIGVMDLTPTYIPSLPRPVSNDYFYNLFTKPWIQSSPYAIGLLLGYIQYHYLRDKKGLKFYYSRSALGIALLWITSVGIALAVLLGPTWFFDVANAENADGSAEAMLYGSLHMFGWDIVMAWVVFACVNEYPRWMSRLLSWQPLVSLGKISLSMYLCAQYIQWVHRISKYEPVRYNASNFIESYVFQLVLSILVGFCLYMTLQAPIERIQDLLSPKQLKDLPVVDPATSEA